MDFADNFNRICKERGTTPTRLLKEMKITTSKVTAWNNGSLPKQDMLIKLAQALDCSVMDFFADDEVTHTPIMVSTPNVEFALDEDEMDIIRLYRSLPRKTQHAFMVAAYNYEQSTQKED
jgi:transcriptional regulator with XRE-family HTH domain